MKQVLTLVGFVTLTFGLNGCTNGAVKFAREMAKNPATMSISIKQSNQWTGQTEVSVARTGTNGIAVAKEGSASVNEK